MHRRLLTPLTVLALVVGACGGSTVDVERASPTADDADPTTTAPTTAAATPTTSASTTTTTTAPADTGVPALATTPQELTARLVAAETTTRDPSVVDDEFRTAAFEHQVLYRQLARTPDWLPTVLADVPESLRTAVEANVAARQEFRSMHSTLSDTLPAWRIIDPVPAGELLALYREAEATFGVPWEILAAVNLVETGMGRIRGVSVAGAQGPMQFMPATWDAFGAGGDVNDPRDAIMGAARYLAHNGGGEGRIDDALWNYNHSDRYVRGVKHYASIMADDPAAYRAFDQWQVVYLSEDGELWLPTGYEQAERVAVVDYLASNPDHLITTSTD